MSEQTENDKNLEKLLTVVSHYTFAELEDIVPFDSKSEDDREEIMKVAIKSMETTVIILKEFFPSGSLNFNKLNNVSQKLEEQKFDDAYKILKEN